jgi:hypothetical protein
MEAARTSETSVDNYFTRQYIPEDKSELHTRRRENLKSHMYTFWRNEVPDNLTRRCQIGHIKVLIMCLLPPAEDEHFATASFTSRLIVWHVIQYS